MQRRITRTTVRTDRRARAEIASSLFICLALLSPTVSALGVEPPPVEWSTSYDGRAPSSGNYVEPVDGGFVVAGSTPEAQGAGKDALLVKFASTGDFLWESTFGGPGDCAGFGSVAQTSDGGFIAAGSVDPACAGSEDRSGLDAYVVKTDPDGNVEWEWRSGREGADRAYWARPMGDGGFLVVGDSGDFFENALEVYLAKIEWNGEETRTVWETTVGGEGNDAPVSVTETADGFIVAYETCVGPFADGPYFLKTVEVDDEVDDASAVGDSVVVMDLTDWMPCGGRNIQPTADGGFIVTATKKDADLSPDEDLLLLKIGLKIGEGKDVEWEIEWDRTYGGLGHDLGLYVQETGDGGFVVLGQTRFGRGDFRRFLLRTDPDGQRVWEQTLDDFPRGVQQAADGGFIVVAGTGAFPDTSFSVAKFAPEPDCDENSTPDGIDLLAGTAVDCNQNCVPDACDVANGTSQDCNDNDVPDECEVSRFPATLVDNTTGADDEDFVGVPDNVAFGIGGQSVTFDFGVARIFDGDGPDLNVHELEGNVFAGDREFDAMDVLVSEDNETFISIKDSEGPYARVPGDEAYANVAFSRSYDLSASGLGAVRYLRIDGLGDEPADGEAGFDLDAVAAVHYTACLSEVEATFRRGDCNDDGNVDISDAISTLGVLFLGQGEITCQDACDSNDDGAVDISDAIATLGVLFLGNRVIPLPGMTECGVDPTDDQIGCDTFEMCP